MSEPSRYPSLITLYVLGALLEASSRVLSSICRIYKTKLRVWSTVGKSELLQEKLPISSWIRNEENNHEGWRETRKLANGF